MIFADPRDLPLDELFGRRDAGLDLAGGVERADARAVEFEGLPPRAAPSSAIALSICA